tara:strand:- start:285 stop:722 length:438 start_codon:yes stop_codon:yes gene_type:complete
MSINFVGDLSQHLPARVLQVTRNSTTSEFNANSTSFSNTFTVAITPKSSSSHFLLIACPVRLLQGGSTDGIYRLLQSSTAGQNTYRIPYNGSGGKNPVMIFNFPTNRTAGSSITFTLQAKTSTADTNIIGDNGSTSTFTCIEYEA